MRRPRSKLQVSTFPFLAVLLCAMGSLLLLLFIMDRRAKIAARYRVSEEMEARKSRTKAEEDARQAEWEKAREALHLSLLAQQNQVDDKAKSVQNELSEASKKLAAEQNRDGDLKKQAREEAGKITLLQLEIEAQRNGLTQADRKEASTKAELLAAAQELAELELVFQQLRALKEREKETYSVVPYRGKRGDARPPVYVECARDGVLFHPEKTLLRTWSFTPDEIRAEVEKRHGPLALQKSAKEQSKSADEPKGPYVLFLIRPDGIGSYYKAQASLRGYQLDFGYELVDAAWVLDFNVKAKNAPARPQQPFRSDVGLKPKPIVVPPFVGDGPLHDGPLGGPVVPMRPPGTSGVGPGNPGGPGVGVGNPGGPKVPPPTGFPGGANPGAVGPALPPPPMIGDPSYKGVDTGIPPRPPSFVPITKIAPPVPIASAGGPNPTGKPGTNAGTNGPGLDLSSVTIPIPGNNVGGQRPAGNPGDPSKPSTGTPGEPGGNPGDSAKPGAGTPGEPGGRALPSFGRDDGKKPSPAPPLSKLLGNKDFIIRIDCRSDYIKILPGEFTYRLTGTNLKATDEALVQTITNLIARRQASVRPGEPPYRPVIRLQVSPDGLRSYHHVHPLLSHLNVTMSRENVAE